LPKCKAKCGSRVKSSRSQLCSICFKKKAAIGGARSAGNANAVGNPDNIGNANAAGSQDNIGNTDGNTGNVGNQTTGVKKKRAGKRSGLKRSAKYGLVVKRQWLDLIFAGKKDWEIRGSATERRGWIHFAESKAGGKLTGRARLVDCLPIPKPTFLNHVRRHCVAKLSKVPYSRIYAWVLEDAERFPEPFIYNHRPGAVIWVKV